MPVPVPSEVIESYRKAFDGATPSGTMDDAKLLDARTLGARNDRADDARFQKVYGRARRW